MQFYAHNSNFHMVWLWILTWNICRPVSNIKRGLWQNDNNTHCEVTLVDTLETPEYCDVMIKVCTVIIKIQLSRKARMTLYFDDVTLFWSLQVCHQRATHVYLIVIHTYIYWFYEWRWNKKIKIQYSSLSYANSNCSMISYT